jgi:hypothetical protein
MSFERFTITFPAELAVRVRRCARPRGFSTYLATAAREKLQREDKEILKKTLGESYALAAKEDQVLADEWDAVVGDGL